MTMAAYEINQFDRVPRSLELEVDPATENIKQGENMKIDDILTDRLGFEDISPRASSEYITKNRVTFYLVFLNA